VKLWHASGEFLTIYYADGREEEVQCEYQNEAGSETVKQTIEDAKEFNVEYAEDKAGE
jgi:hypothetical protein